VVLPGARVGGFLGLDPVENAALLPWLCATAYLHSVMVQERRGLLRVWNLSLLIAAFSLTILGTFLTRSGVLVSVHSFTDSSAIGPALLASSASWSPPAWAHRLAGGPVAVARVDRLAGVARRRLLVNNLLFAAFAVVVLIGTVFPSSPRRSATSSSRWAPRTTTPSRCRSASPCCSSWPWAGPAWRKGTSELLRHRLAAPAFLAVAVLLACVIGGVRGLTPLAAFGLGAFAGGSALRQLVLGVKAAHRAGFGPGAASSAGRTGAWSSTSEW